MISPPRTKVKATARARASNFLLISAREMTSLARAILGSAPNTMIRRRKSDHVVRPFSVTTADGTKFRCSLATLGRETEPRWILIGTDGVQYVGPLAGHDKSPVAVEKLVSEWWGERKNEPGG